MGWDGMGWDAMGWDGMNDDHVLAANPSPPPSHFTSHLLTSTLHRYAAATAMQRVWRGVVGRREADVKAIEMADFIGMIRKKEAALVEEEYWRNNTWARLKRDFKELINPKPVKSVAGNGEEEEERRAEEEERLKIEEEEDKKWIFEYDEDSEAFKQEIGL